MKMLAKVVGICLIGWIGSELAADAPEWRITGSGTGYLLDGYARR